MITGSLHHLSLVAWLHLSDRVMVISKRMRERIMHACMHGKRMIHGKRIIRAWQEHVTHTDTLTRAPPTSPPHSLAHLPPPPHSLAHVSVRFYLLQDTSKNLIVVLLAKVLDAHMSPKAQAVDLNPDPASEMILNDFASGLNLCTADNCAKIAEYPSTPPVV